MVKVKPLLVSVSQLVVNVRLTGGECERADGDS